MKKLDYTTPHVPHEPKFSATILIPPLIAVAMALVMHLLGPMVGAYRERILLDIAVAIIAAVSLTIVNGFTGQFSIGHAAFMALGGYTAAWISYYTSLRIWGTTTPGTNAGGTQWAAIVSTTIFGACAIVIMALAKLRKGRIGVGDAGFIAVIGCAVSSIFYFLSQRNPDASLGAASLFGAQQWLLLMSAIIGGLVAAGAGWLVGLPSLRLKGDYLAIVTLGFGEILRVLLQQTNAQKYTLEELQASPLIGFGTVAGEQGYLLPPGIGGSLGFTDIPKVTNLFWAYLFVAVTLLFAYRLKQSSYGRALLSIREDEIAAEAMGVNVTKLKVRAFMLAAFFAGVAGTLYAHQPGTTLRPVDAGFLRSFDIVMMVVLGGLGSISGSVLAAIVITILNAWLVPLGPYRMILFALALILMMIFRPQGLFGLREIWDWLAVRRRHRT